MVWPICGYWPLMSNVDGPGSAYPRDIAGAVPSDLDVDQTFDIDGLYALRSTVAAHASHLEATDTELEALVIITSELATNAIRHGGGVGRIQLWHDSQYLYVRVTDEGPGLVDTAAGMTLPDPERLGGRGMWIVRSLSHDLVVGTGPAERGTSITARIRRAG